MNKIPAKSREWLSMFDLRLRSCLPSQPSIIRSMYHESISYNPNQHILKGCMRVLVRNDKTGYHDMPGILLIKCPFRKMI